MQYGVDALGPCDLADDVARGERAVGHVILEGDGLHRSVRVLPADHEYREALLEQEADKTVLRLQVEDIELVDPRRNEQQRHGVGLRRHRRVMDELDEAVAIDDLAGSRGEVLARRERCGVGHAEPALAKIVQKVAEPVGDAAAARLPCLAKRRGIGRQKRGGAYRVEELPEMEDKPLPFVGINRLPLGFLEKLFGKREIALLQQPEEGVLLPFRSVEAPVGLGAFRPGRCGGCESPQARRGVDPDLGRFSPHRQAQIGGRRRCVDRIRR